MSAELKPDAKGFRYVLMWMDELLKRQKPADMSYLLEWCEFTQQAADRIADLERQNAELVRQRADLVRYCPECSYIGDVPATAINCCPDGNHAAYVPREIAMQAQAGFLAMLGARLGQKGKDHVRTHQEAQGGDPAAASEGRAGQATPAAGEIRGGAAGAAGAGTPSIAPQVDLSEGGHAD